MTSPIEPFDDISQRRAFDPHRPIVVVVPVQGFPSSFNSTGGDVHQTGADTSASFVLGPEDRLQSFVLTESDKKIDKAEITFIDDEGIFADPANLAVGAQIDVAYGYPGKLSQPVRLIVRRLKLGMVQGRKWAKRRRGFIVSLTALAPGVLALAVPSENTIDTFENLPLSSIVKIVAEKLGYHERASGDHAATIDVPDARNGSHTAYTKAVTETYGQFLARIARQNGMLYWIEHGGKHPGLHFEVRKDEELAGPIIDLDGDRLIGFDLDGDLILAIPASVRVVGFDPGTARVVDSTKEDRPSDHKRGSGPGLATSKAGLAEAQTPTEGQVESAPEEESAPASRVIHGRAVVRTNGVSNLSALNKSKLVVGDVRPASADKVHNMAEAHFSERIKKTWKLRVRVVGEPDLRAKQNVLLQNFETGLLDGVWYVREVQHTIDPGGYVTQLSCVRRTGPAKGGHGVVRLVKSEKNARTKAEEAIQDANKLIGGNAVIDANSASFNNPGKKHHARRPPSVDDPFHTSRQSPRSSGYK